MSEFIEWTSDLELGVYIVDEEHKTLVDYLNKLHKLKAGSDNDLEMKAILDGLGHYTQTHFVVEEEFMRIYKYPALTGHKRAHDDFVERLTALRSVVKEGGLDVSKNLLNFMRDWLVVHILKTDAQLMAFLKGKGVN